MLKRIVTAFVSVVMFVSFFYAELPADAFIEEDAYAYAANALNLGMKNKEDVIDLSGYMLPAQFAAQLYYDVLLADPYLYFVKMDYKDTTCTLSEDGEYIESYTIEYYFTETSVTDVIFEEHLQKAVSDIPVEGMHTVDQLLAIHEYIANNVDKEKSLSSITDNRLCSTAYGALVYGCADSLGYALAYMLLAESITDNECIVVSDADKLMYWNMYRLNGNWYNIDVYSDDTEVFYVDSEQNVTDTYIYGSMRNHIYFLETTNVMSMYGHTTPVAYIYGGTPTSAVDTVRIRIWNNITSPMQYYDGYWYYVSPASPDILVKRLTNVAALVSTEETVFLAEGNIISFAMTYDSIFYAVDTGSVKKLPLSLIEKEEIYESDVETTSEENVDSDSGFEQEITEKEIYNCESDIEIILGMGNRDDRIYYELYNTSDNSYSYNIAGDFYESLELPTIEDSVITGIDGNTRVMDFVDVLSKTGVVNRFDAYNSLKVIYAEKELQLVQFLSTGSKLVLADNTEYDIVVSGDVIPGSNINILDVMTVLNYINGSTAGLNELQIRAMDYDGIDGVNVADVALIYKAITDINVVKDSDTMFDLIVNGGFAEIEGNYVSESSHNTQINIVADVPDGMVFDKWIVVSGNVNLANTKAANTSFVMPYSNVEVTATFKTATAVIETITFDNVYERYWKIEPKPISFTNTGEMVLTNPFVSIKSGSEYFDLITYSLPYYIKSGETNNTSYAIQPKVCLPYGTYTAELVLSANELDAEISTIVTFTVEHFCYGFIVEGKAPDCTSDGWKSYFACACGKYSEDMFGVARIVDLDAWKKDAGKIPAHGHEYGDLIEKRDPIHSESEVSPGMAAHYICGDCGLYFTEEKELTSFEGLIIPVSEHVHNSYDMDESCHWSVCICGTTISNSEEKHDFGEDDSGTVCLTCGYEKFISYAVSGAITSHIVEFNDITVELLDSNYDVMYSVVVTDYTEISDTDNQCLATYRFDEVAVGTYTLRIVKSDHMIIETSIIVSDSDVYRDLEMMLVDVGDDTDTGIGDDSVIDS